MRRQDTETIDLLQALCCTNCSHGFEGREATVDVYSDADQVELLLNGKQIGLQPAGEQHGYTAVFQVPYAAGRLEARAIRDGQPAETFALETAAEEVLINAWPEADIVSAKHRGIAFVPVQLCDSDGKPNAQIQKQITATVTGNITLQGFGSANPSCEGNYGDTTWATYDGRAMAVVRAEGSAGKGTITFSSEGCSPCAVEVLIR